MVHCEKVQDQRNFGHAVVIYSKSSEKDFSEEEDFPLLNSALPEWHLSREFFFFFM
jgi:hypothetical protein